MINLFCREHWFLRDLNLWIIQNIGRDIDRTTHHLLGGVTFLDYGTPVSLLHSSNSVVFVYNCDDQTNLLVDQAFVSTKMSRAFKSAVEALVSPVGLSDLSICCSLVLHNQWRSSAPIQRFLLTRNNWGSFVDSCLAFAQHFAESSHGTPTGNPSVSRFEDLLTTCLQQRRLLPQRAKASFIFITDGKVSSTSSTRLNETFHFLNEQEISCSFISLPPLPQIGVQNDSFLHCVAQRTRGSVLYDADDRPADDVQRSLLGFVYRPRRECLTEKSSCAIDVFDVSLSDFILTWSKAGFRLDNIVRIEATEQLIITLSLILSQVSRFFLLVHILDRSCCTYKVESVFTGPPNSPAVPPILRLMNNVHAIYSHSQQLVRRNEFSFNSSSARWKFSWNAVLDNFEMFDSYCCNSTKLSLLVENRAVVHRKIFNIFKICANYVESTKIFFIIKFPEKDACIIRVTCRDLIAIRFCFTFGVPPDALRKTINDFTDQIRTFLPPAGVVSFRPLDIARPESQSSGISRVFTWNWLLTTAISEEYLPSVFAKCRELSVREGYFVYSSTADSLHLISKIASEDHCLILQYRLGFSADSTLTTELWAEPKFVGDHFRPILGSLDVSSLEEYADRIHQIDCHHFVPLLTAFYFMAKQDSDIKDSLLGFVVEAGDSLGGSVVEASHSLKVTNVIRHCEFAELVFRSHSVNSGDNDILFDMLLKSLRDLFRVEVYFDNCDEISDLLRDRSSILPFSFYGESVGWKCFSSVLSDQCVLEFCIIPASFADLKLFTPNLGDGHKFYKVPVFLFYCQVDTFMISPCCRSTVRKNSIMEDIFGSPLTKSGIFLYKIVAENFCSLPADLVESIRHTLQKIAEEYVRVFIHGMNLAAHSNLPIDNEDLNLSLQECYHCSIGIDMKPFLLTTCQHFSAILSTYDAETQDIFFKYLLDQDLFKSNQRIIKESSHFWIPSSTFKTACPVRPELSYIEDSFNSLIKKYFRRIHNSDQTYFYIPSADMFPFFMQLKYNCTCSESHQIVNFDSLATCLYQFVWFFSKGQHICLDQLNISLRVNLYSCEDKSDFQADGEDRLVNLFRGFPSDISSNMSSLSKEIKWLIADGTICNLMSLSVVNIPILKYIILYIKSKSVKSHCQLKTIPIRFVCEQDYGKSLLLDKLREIRVDRSLTCEFINYGRDKHKSTSQYFCLCEFKRHKSVSCCIPSGHILDYSPTRYSSVQHLSERHSSDSLNSWIFFVICEKNIVLYFHIKEYGIDIPGLLDCQIMIYKKLIKCINTAIHETNQHCLLLDLSVTHCCSDLLFSVPEGEITESGNTPPFKCKKMYSLKLRFPTCLQEGLASQMLSVFSVSNRSCLYFIEESCPVGKNILYFTFMFENVSKSGSHVINQCSHEQTTDYEKFLVIHLHGMKLPEAKFRQNFADCVRTKIASAFAKFIKKEFSANVNSVICRDQLYFLTNSMSNPLVSFSIVIPSLLLNLLDYIINLFVKICLRKTFQMVKTNCLSCCNSLDYFYVNGHSFGFKGVAIVRVEWNKTLPRGTVPLPTDIETLKWLTTLVFSDVEHCHLKESIIESLPTESAEHGFSIKVSIWEFDDGNIPHVLERLKFHARRSIVGSLFDVVILPSLSTADQRRRPQSSDSASISGDTKSAKSAPKHFQDRLLNILYRRNDESPESPSRHKCPHIVSQHVHNVMEWLKFSSNIGMRSIHSFIVPIPDSLLSFGLFRDCATSVSSFLLSHFATTCYHNYSRDYVLIDDLDKYRNFDNFSNFLALYKSSEAFPDSVDVRSLSSEYSRSARDWGDNFHILLHSSYDELNLHIFSPLSTGIKQIRHSVNKISKHFTARSRFMNILNKCKLGTFRDKVPPLPDTPEVDPLLYHHIHRVNYSPSPDDAIDTYDRICQTHVHNSNSYNQYLYARELERQGYSSLLSQAGRIGGVIFDHVLSSSHLFSSVSIPMMMTNSNSGSRTSSVDSQSSPRASYRNLWLLRNFGRKLTTCDLYKYSPSLTCLIHRLRVDLSAYLARFGFKQVQIDEVNSDEHDPACFVVSESSSLIIFKYVIDNNCLICFLFFYLPPDSHSSAAAYGRCSRLLTEIDLNGFLMEFCHRVIVQSINTCLVKLEERSCALCSFDPFGLIPELTFFFRRKFPQKLGFDLHNFVVSNIPISASSLRTNLVGRSSDLGIQFISSDEHPDNFIYGPVLSDRGVVLYCVCRLRICEQNVFKYETYVVAVNSTLYPLSSSLICYSSDCDTTLTAQNILSPHSERLYSSSLPELTREINEIVRCRIEEATRTWYLKNMWSNTFKNFVPVNPQKSSRLFERTKSFRQSYSAFQHFISSLQRVELTEFHKSLPPINFKALHCDRVFKWAVRKFGRKRCVSLPFGSSRNFKVILSSSHVDQMAIVIEQDDSISSKASVYAVLYSDIGQTTTDIVETNRDFVILFCQHLTFSLWNSLTSS